MENVKPKVMEKYALEYRNILKIISLYGFLV